MKTTQVLSASLLGCGICLPVLAHEGHVPQMSTHHGEGLLLLTLLISSAVVVGVIRVRASMRKKPLSDSHD